MSFWHAAMKGIIYIVLCLVVVMRIPQIVHSFRKKENRIHIVDRITLCSIYKKHTTITNQDEKRYTHYLSYTKKVHSKQLYMSDTASSSHGKCGKVRTRKCNTASVLFVFNTFAPLKPKDGRLCESNMSKS